MGMDARGNELDEPSGDYGGLFAIRKSLDGEPSSEFVDKMQFIGIKIAGEGFLLSIEHINEIIMLPNITYVPNSAKYIEGVVNLRGNILPVVNLRKMMGMDKGEASVATRIIICKEENLNVRVGLLVDNITFVISLLPEEVDTSSPPSAESGHEMLNGVSKHGTSVSGVADPQKNLAIAADGKPLSTDDEGASSDHAA